MPTVVLYLLAKAKVRTKKETNQKIAMDEGKIFGEEGPMKGPKSSDKEGEAMQVISTYNLIPYFYKFLT